MAEKNTKNPLVNISLGALSLLGGAYLARRAYGWLFTGMMKPILNDPYDKNIWELVNATQRNTATGLVETELRSAAKGGFINRPIGGSRRFDYIKNIMFNINQLATLPTPKEVNINTSVTIGPLASKPLQLNIPILVGGMAYGLSLSEKFKIAIAQGTSMAGTATNTGLGPWLESERKAAKHLILQYPRASWSKDPAIIKQSDAIEIQFGQGANAGVGSTLDNKKINSKLRQRLNLKPGQDAVVHNQMNEANTPGELSKLINYLRELSGGVPIGVKIGAGNNLEQDLDIAVNAGTDFVSLDGAEGGTHGSLPILEDDFGVPTVIALSRAARFWEKNNLKGRVSLLVGGGLSSPGDCLKMLALGADAVYMGTTIVFATTHNQLLKVVPFEPPTAIAWEDGKYKDKFNVKEGANSLANFLHATVYEMEEAVKALGKTSVSQVSRADMFALNREVAEITGLELCYRPAK